MKPSVYFTNELTPESVKSLFDRLGVKLSGKVALKLHSGEAGNQNFLSPGWFAPLVEELHATVVECNTAYPGARDTTKKHLKLLKDHAAVVLLPNA